MQGMLWYGMVWYVMVCYGMLWYGMVWYVMVWYGMVWHGMAWFGLVGYDYTIVPEQGFVSYISEPRQLRGAVKLLLQGHRNNPPLHTPFSLQSLCSQRHPPPRKNISKMLNNQMPSLRHCYERII